MLAAVAIKLPRASRGWIAPRKRHDERSGVSSQTEKVQGYRARYRQA